MVPERGRTPPVPFLMSICLIAMSSDFFEIFLPNPELSVDVAEGFIGFRIDNSGTCDALRDSTVSTACDPGCKRPFTGVSESLPLEPMGDGCLRGTLLGVGFSTFPLTVRATPGLDLPAESGLSGNVVRRFGGVSSEKSGRIIGCGRGRTRGLGELGRDNVAALRPLDGIRPIDIESPVSGDKGVVDGDKEGAEFRRVGVDGREADLVAGVFKFAGIDGLEFGVEGLEFGDGLVLSMEVVVVVGRPLEGVEDLDATGRADGVEGLAVEEDIEDRDEGVEGLAVEVEIEERVAGEDGLI